MILKELDPFLSGMEALEARISADRMAYYLRRFYRRSEAVDVVNELSIPSGNSIARADHLILHAYGLLVVQREDIAGRVQINDDGQWLQLSSGRAVPIGSPITRAYVHSLLLKAFLDKRVRQKGFFDNLDLDVLVVVSDDCDIAWPPSGRLPEVCKREQVFARVTERLVQSRRGATVPGRLNASERRVLGRFLTMAHGRTPRTAPD